MEKAIKTLLLKLWLLSVTAQLFSQVNILTCCWCNGCWCGGCRCGGCRCSSRLVFFLCRTVSCLCRDLLKPSWSHLFALKLINKPIKKKKTTTKKMKMTQFTFKLINYLGLQAVSCDLSGISPVTRIRSESITSSVGPVAWSPAFSWLAASVELIGWLNQRSKVTTTLPWLRTESQDSARGTSVHSHKPNWSIWPEGWNLTGLEETADSAVAVRFEYLPTNKRPACDHVTTKLKLRCQRLKELTRFHFYSLLLLTYFVSFPQHHAVSTDFQNKSMGAHQVFHVEGQGFK